MNADDMQKRTKIFALRIIKLSEGLSHTGTAEIIGRQLLRCGTSVGANYRSACRAKSLADFIAKMAIVEEEADEVVYWLDLLVESGLIQQRHIDLLSEANQIVAMTVASIKTARRNKTTQRPLKGDPMHNQKLFSPYFSLADSHSLIRIPHSPITYLPV
jgi:four helix bundle protein